MLIYIIKANLIINLRKIFSILLLIIIGLVIAGSGSPPKITKTYSSNKKYCLEVIPRGYYSEDSSCAGKYYLLDSLNEYQLLWSRPLLNVIAPVTVLISDDGNSIVTLDEWGSAGYGENTAVIYDAEGDILMYNFLEDILPADEIQKIKIKDKSRLWRGACEINNSRGLLVLKTVSNGEDPASKKAIFRTINISLKYCAIYNDDDTIPNDWDMIPNIDAFVPVDQPARSMEYVRPGYPELSRRMEYEGTAYIKMLVDLDGSVMRVVLIKSSGFPELDSAAVEAAHKWIFAPAQLQGKPVRVWVAAPFKFELQ